ncbi:hypothetical protein HMPREF3033_01410 [Veillonellaceae bacterium DNF00751]|nr:hypothetical protein HMPREF3033_01410 [Veillonellaceae bacterium DNF00751]
MFGSASGCIHKPSRKDGRRRERPVMLKNKTLHKDSCTDFLL